jgi:hypothetical protein
VGFASWGGQCRVDKLGWSVRVCRASVVKLVGFHSLME